MLSFRIFLLNCEVKERNFEINEKYIILNYKISEYNKTGVSPGFVV